MPVMVTSNFDDDSKKMNELAWRQHFPIIILCEFFRRLRAANSVVSGPIWPKFELARLQGCLLCRIIEAILVTRHDNLGNVPPSHGGSA